MRKAYRPKRKAQIVRLITTWFISEHRKSCDRKMSAQSNQKMVFKRIMPHSPVNRNFFCLSRSYDSGHAQLDCVALVLFCGPYDWGQVRNISAQPDQIIRFRTSVQRYFGGEDTVCHVSKIHINIRLHSLLN